MHSLLSRSVTPEVEIEHQVEKDLWLTTIDPGDFEDAILNMVINARDAMEGHGHLILKTSNTILDEKFCKSNPGFNPGEYVELCITDHGKGMTPEQQEHIFEPFYTTKVKGKGTGLGLAMVYSFITRSKGYIKIDSEVGVGTTFHIYLPKDEMINTKKSLLEDKQENNNEPHQKGHETILVVDDEESLCFLAKEILEERGYKVLLANNGKEALEQLKKNYPIDLIFSDVVMPGGVGGYQLAEQAMAEFPKLKILLTSGHENVVPVNDEQQHLHANLLKKPYSSADLAKRIRTLLDET